MGAFIFTHGCCSGHLPLGVDIPSNMRDDVHFHESSSSSWVASLTFFMASRGHSHSLPWLSFTLTNRFPSPADTDIRAYFAWKGKTSTDASNKKQGGGWYRPLTQSGQSLFHFDQLYVIAGHLTGVK
jgi:hypothetical protein